MREIVITFLTLLLSTLVMGCNTANPVVPDKIVNISPSLQIPYEMVAATMIVGAITWYVIDPLAPTWDIQHTRASQDTFDISLTQKRFATGGDGEAQYLFRRHAKALARGHGFVGFNIISYEESIQSGPVIGQRTAWGRIQLGEADTTQYNAMR